MCKRATRARLRVRCVPPRQPGTPCIGIPLSLTKTCYPGSGQNPQECTPTDAQNPLVSPILRLVDAFTQINQPASIPNSAMANPSASVMTPGAGPGCCSVALQENQLMTACNCKQANGNICIMDESCTVFNRSIPTGITYNFTTPISCQEAINQQILVDDDIRQCEANVEQLQVKVKCVQPPGAAPTCFPYIDDRQPSSYFEPYSHISKEAIAQPTQTPLTPSVWQGPVGCCDVYIRPSHLVVACGCESTAEQSSISSCSQALLNDDLARCTMSKQFSARDLPNIQNSSHRKTTKRTLGELANTVAYSLPITCSKALDEGLIEPSAIEQCRSQVLIPQTHPTYSYRYTYEDSNLDTGTPTQPVLTTQPVLVDIPGKQSVPAQPSPQYSYPQWPGYATTRSDSQPSVQPAYSQWQQYGTYSAGSSYESQHGQQSSPQVYNPSIPMNGYGFYTTAPYQSTTPPPPTSVIPLAPRAQTPSYKSPNNHGYPAGYQEPTRHPYTIGKFGTSTNRVMVPSQADLTTESALQGESSACTPLNSAQWLLGFISLFILFIL
uniref:Protein lifeguard 1 n=1 Tax=Haemonchus contortus TaxID=6289 RepID=A0A7I4XZH4_HAECO